MAVNHDQCEVIALHFFYQGQNVVFDRPLDCVRFSHSHRVVRDRDYAHCSKPRAIGLPCTAAEHEGDALVVIAGVEMTSQFAILAPAQREDGFHDLLS
jgi:hypothetical protein